MPESLLDNALARSFHAMDRMLGPLRGLRSLVLLGLFTAAVAALLLLARPAEPARAPNVQLGLASYYGPGFHGEETASGEIFNQRELVAAHRTLPLGTIVRVTNLQNGRDVVVRVIDRGPYGRNRRKGTIIDLSKGAARQLQFLRDGLVRVRVEVIEPADRISSR
jgi:rare lipoprotein A